MTAFRHASVRRLALVGLLIGLLGLGAWVYRPRERAKSEVLLTESDAITTRYTGLVRAYHAADVQVVKAIERAKPAERAEALRRRDEQRAEFARRFLDVARQAPNHTVALSALGWVMEYHPDSSEGAEGVELLLKNWGDHKWIGGLCGRLAETEPATPEATVSPQVATLLRGVLERNSHPEVRAQAQLALARNLKRRSERPGWAGSATAAPEDLVREAEARLETLTDSEANALRFGPERTIGQVAERELRELRELRVGQPAPEIEGVDLEGRPMKLSDYRGRLVVLEFWGNWCSVCQKTFPQKQRQAEQLKNQPAVQLGVNSDVDPARARRLERREQITHRSWYDGGEVRGGAIAQSWNVQALPTTYVIDHEGRIRGKFPPRSDGHDATRLILFDGQVHDKWQRRGQAIEACVERVLSEMDRQHAKAERTPERG